MRGLGFCIEGLGQGLRALGYDREFYWRPRYGEFSRNTILLDDFCERFMALGGEDSRLYYDRASYVDSIATFLGFRSTNEHYAAHYFFEYAKERVERLKKPQLINPRRISEVAV